MEMGIRLVVSRDEVIIQYVYWFSQFEIKYRESLLSVYPGSPLKRDSSPPSIVIFTSVQWLF
jgi:hypothetical protein